MKILVFGGTFNPPHNGHLHIAKSAMDVLSCDKLIVIPAKLRHFKPECGSTPPDAERLMLCRAAFSSLNASVLDYELTSKNGYLIDTLSYLSGIYPEDELIFLCGSDAFLSLEHWYRVNEMGKYCKFAVYPRSDFASTVSEKAVFYNAAYGINTFLINASEYPCSSSEIRIALKNGIVSPHIPKEVTAIIDENGLYKTDIIKN